MRKDAERVHTWLSAKLARLRPPRGGPIQRPEENHPTHVAFKVGLTRQPFHQQLDVPPHSMELFTLKSKMHEHAQEVMQVGFLNEPRVTISDLYVYSRLLPVFCVILVAMVFMCPWCHRGCRTRVCRSKSVQDERPFQAETSQSRVSTAETTPSQGTFCATVVQIVRNFFCMSTNEREIELEKAVIALQAELEQSEAQMLQSSREIERCRSLLHKRAGLLASLLTSQDHPDDGVDGPCSPSELHHRKVAEMATLLLDILNWKLGQGSPLPSGQFWRAYAVCEAMVRDLAPSADVALNCTRQLQRLVLEFDLQRTGVPLEWRWKPARMQAIATSTSSNSSLSTRYFRNGRVGRCFMSSAQDEACPAIDRHTTSEADAVITVCESTILSSRFATPSRKGVSKHDTMTRQNGSVYASLNSDGGIEENRQQFRGIDTPGFQSDLPRSLLGSPTSPATDTEEGDQLWLLQLNREIAMSQLLIDAVPADATGTWLISGHLKARAQQTLELQKRKLWRLEQPGASVRGIPAAIVEHARDQANALLRRYQGHYDQEPHIREWLRTVRRDASPPALNISLSEWEAAAAAPQLSPLRALSMDQLSPDTKSVVDAMGHCSSDSSKGRDRSEDDASRAAGVCPLVRAWTLPVGGSLIWINDLPCGTTVKVRVGGVAMRTLKAGERFELLMHTVGVGTYDWRRLDPAANTRKTASPPSQSCTKLASDPRPSSEPGSPDSLLGLGSLPSSDNMRTEYLAEIRVVAVDAITQYGTFAKTAQKVGRVADLLKTKRKTPSSKPGATSPDGTSKENEVPDDQTSMVAHGNGDTNRVALDLPTDQVDVRGDAGLTGSRGYVVITEDEPLAPATGRSALEPTMSRNIDGVAEYTAHCADVSQREVKAPVTSVSHDVDVALTTTRDKIHDACDGVAYIKPDNNTQAAAVAEAAAALVHLVTFARSTVASVADRGTALSLLPAVAEHIQALERTSSALAVATGCMERVTELLLAVQKIPATRGARQHFCDSLAVEYFSHARSSAAIGIALEAHAASMMLKAVSSALTGPAPRARERLRRLNSPQIECTKQIIISAAGRADPSSVVALQAASDRLQVISSALARMRRVLPPEARPANGKEAPVTSMEFKSEEDESLDAGGMMMAKEGENAYDPTIASSVPPGDGAISDAATRPSATPSTTERNAPDHPRSTPTGSGSSPTSSELYDLDCQLEAQRVELAHHKEALVARRRSRGGGGSAAV